MNNINKTSNKEIHSLLLDLYSYLKVEKISKVRLINDYIIILNS
jgi:hypothetical protein